ncbi:unnamed protein product [Aphanomyces euteiches]
MKPSIVSSAVSTIVVAALFGQASGATICNSLVPYSYTSAEQQFPDMKNAIDLLKNNAVASWYTDRGTNPVADVLAKCTNSIPVIVIYGVLQRCRRSAMYLTVGLYNTGIQPDE